MIRNQTPDSDPQGYGSGNSHAGTDSVPIHDGGLGRKLLLIEKGEYASEDFMDEIKDVIAGLIQNYEVIRDSEVMMSKEANSIGKCPLCGSAVEDKAKAFFCSNRACKFALWKTIATLRASARA